MTERKQQRFAPHGALAVHPKAFGALFDVVNPEPMEANPEGSTVAIVPVRGPLMNHAELFFDSYESIKSRVSAAIEAGARTVVLDIDSPGGLVHGVFDTSRALRKMCADAGVDLRAHVTGQATSAAYALATAASVIGVSPSATIGSIGVIDMLVDATAQNEAIGINVQVVTSGDRKADGNPNVVVSDSAFAASQSRVNELAGMFFELVVEHGWCGTTERLEALQAGVFTGAAAASMELVTMVATLAETIALEAAPADGAEATETERENVKMAEPMEDAVASLRSLAEGEDEEEATKAKAALKALGVEGFGDEEEATDEPEDKPDAEDEPEDKPDAKAEGEDEDKSAKAAHAIAVAAMAEVHNMKATAAKAKSDAERADLLASRPDFAPELVAILSDAKKTPLATVRDMCANLAKGPSRSGKVAAAATATGTRGELQGDGMGPRLSLQDKAKLDAQMGLTEMTTETVNTAHKMTFGARRPVAANAGKGK